MPKRICIARGPKCSNGGFAVPGTSRCPAHTRAWRQKTPASKAGYYNTAAWRERRKRQLAEFPYCARCGAPAAIADHIHNIGAGGDPNGPLQSLCRPCHQTKTSAEGGRAAKRKRLGL